MKAQLAAFFRSSRVRAVASYPFRLGSADTNWRSSPFAGLAAVHNVSSIGDAFVTVALAGSVFVSVSLSAARGRTALGLICTVLPFAVVGPFVGPVVDRVKGGRKFIVFLAAVGRMVACVLMATWIHSLLLFPAAFLSLVCSKTHQVARASLVPATVGSEEDLVRANSKLAVGTSVSTSIAAAVAALIYRVSGSRAVLDVDVLIFAATAGMSLSLLSRVQEPAAASVADNSHPKRRRPYIPQELRAAQVAMAGMRAAAGFLTALVVFAFRREGAPVIWYGLVAIASVGGNFGGALIAPTLREYVSEKKLVGGAAILIGVTAGLATDMTAAHRRVAALLLAVVIGVGASVAKTAFDATVQRVTRDADRSRLFARFESIFQLVWVLGALIPTLIDTSLFVGFIVIACVVLVTSTVFVTGVARAQPAPEPPVPAPRPSPPTPRVAVAEDSWGPPPPPPPIVQVPPTD